MSDDILVIDQLRTYFETDGGLVKAVDGVDLAVPRGGILGLVGESGSGKSVTGLSVLGLLGRKRSAHDGGRILFNGTDLLGLAEPEMRRLRGAEIGLVTQNALTGLDPSFRIGDQLTEVIRRHQKVNKQEAIGRAISALERVTLPDPDRVMSSLPHQLSGGQRQRALIAMALACEPQLLIADEPTTALDATVQKQIVDLLVRINQESRTSIMVITHDFGVVARMCTSVAVMRHGRVLEKGTTARVMDDPAHPYTRGLMNAVPRLRLSAEERAVPRRERRLFELEKTLPAAADENEELYVDA